MQEITLQEMKAVKLMNRTDTKFVTNKKMLEELLALIDNEYYVQATDGEIRALYHTLYFDTMDAHMYLIHQNGKKTRQKLRIRSYIKSDLHFLEIKNKNNHGQTKKKRVELQLAHNDKSDFSLCEELINYNPIKTHSDFLDSKLWIPAHKMLPVIENNFTRMTLVNKLKTERLTIDTNLGFHNLITDKSLELDNLAIIELKRDSLQPSPILPYLNRLRIFSMGFSKYCIGMAMTNQSLKKNRFKQRIHIIEKL